MIACDQLFDSFKKSGIHFFAGVPDSLLKDFCAYITDNTNATEHIITANEGAAIGLAAGYHLATGNVPMVYLQNSGLGNTINPILSLADKEVYGIPMIVMIGWRGEPGVKDEPQHVKQGRVQNALLDAMEIPYRILDSSISNTDAFIAELTELAISKRNPVAIVVKGDSFAPYKLKNKIVTNFEMKREDAVKAVLSSLPETAIIVSTTGKTSREVFEYRVNNGQGNQNDFLTVGSMGHTSQIALGIALNHAKPVVCLDGDGSIIMHMGSLAIVGNSDARHLIHVVINNGAHDSVGGQPTAGFEIDLPAVAKACGYKAVFSINKAVEVPAIITQCLAGDGPFFVEIKTNKGAREDLGRPTKTPGDNKKALMDILIEQKS
jgi:phosphonopyruvate decarboxylase